MRNIKEDIRFHSVWNSLTRDSFIVCLGTKKMGVYGKIQRKKKRHVTTNVKRQGEIKTSYRETIKGTTRRQHLKGTSTRKQGMRTVE